MISKTRPRRWLIAALAALLSACSTPPAPPPSILAPRQIDPPPLALAAPCDLPGELAAAATAADLADWALAWMAAWHCERGRRAGLAAAWPR
jgi:hypothetical protein